jgi:hypothetical protein
MASSAPPEARQQRALRRYGAIDLDGASIAQLQQLIDHLALGCHGSLDGLHPPAIGITAQKRARRSWLPPSNASDRRPRGRRRVANALLDAVWRHVGGAGVGTLCRLELRGVRLVQVWDKSASSKAAIHPGSARLSPRAANSNMHWPDIILSQLDAGSAGDVSLRSGWIRLVQALSPGSHVPPHPPGMRALEALHLSGCNLGAASLPLISALCTDAPRLRSLQLSGCCLPASAAPALAALITKHGRSRSDRLYESLTHQWEQSLHPVGHSAWMDSPRGYVQDYNRPDGPLCSATSSAHHPASAPLAAPSHTTTFRFTGRQASAPSPSSAHITARPATAASSTPPALPAHACPPAGLDVLIVSRNARLLSTPDAARDLAHALRIDVWLRHVDLRATGASESSLRLLEEAAEGRRAIGESDTGREQMRHEGGIGAHLTICDDTAGARPVSGQSKSGHAHIRRDKAGAGMMRHFTGAARATAMQTTRTSAPAAVQRGKAVAPEPTAVELGKGADQPPVMLRLLVRGLPPVSQPVARPVSRGVGQGVGFRRTSGAKGEAGAWRKSGARNKAEIGRATGSRSMAGAQREAGVQQGAGSRLVEGANRQAGNGRGIWSSGVAGLGREAGAGQGGDAALWSVRHAKLRQQFAAMRKERRRADGANTVGGDRSHTVEEGAERTGGGSYFKSSFYSEGGGGAYTPGGAGSHTEGGAGTLRGAAKSAHRVGPAISVGSWRRPAPELQRGGNSASEDPRVSACELVKLCGGPTPLLDAIESILTIHILL